MRLCDALRQTISEYGSGAVSGESLPELLSQRGAFDGCPGLRDAVNAFAALGLGRELSLLSHDDRSGLLSFVSRTSEALVAKGGIREDLARYTAESIASALGLSDREPEEPSPDGESLDHGSGDGTQEAGAAGNPAGMYRLVSPSLQKRLSGARNQGLSPSLLAGGRGRKSALFSVSWHGPEKEAPGAEDAGHFLELGEMSYYGEGAPQDYREAAKWFIKAAEHGRRGGRALSWQDAPLGSRGQERSRRGRPAPEESRRERKCPGPVDAGRHV